MKWQPWKNWLQGLLSQIFSILEAPLVFSVQWHVTCIKGEVFYEAKEENKFIFSSISLFLPTYSKCHIALEKKPQILLFFQEIDTAEGLGVALEPVTRAEVQISSSVKQPQFHSFSSFTLTMPQNQTNF